MSERTIQRIDKGADSPEFKGQGSTYLLPRDEMPEGVKEGERRKFIIEGVVGSVDESGAVINVEKITSEILDARNDHLQNKLEGEMNKS